VTADALELEPHAQPEFVAAACGDDADVYGEVLRLLAEAKCSRDDFLSSFSMRLPSLLAQPAEPKPCFSRGQIVAGRFRIERFISSGGMGEVYSAMDMELREIVALKTIRPAIANSTVAIERFKQEVSQSRRITHPNVCRVYDMFSHEEPSGESLWFLTMELLDGRTLGESLAADGPRRIDQAVPLIRDMVVALGAAHALGIVHRDFKPNNVMLVKKGTEPERAIVTDFGLALNVITEHVVSGAEAAAGTPAYMAPEQWAGKSVGVATDQFALGLVICEMLTGTRPELDGKSAGESRRQLRAWLKRQPRRAIDSRLRRVIVRCLQFDPEDRFRDVLEIPPVMDGSHLRSRVRRALVVACLAVPLVVTLFLGVTEWTERVKDAVPLTSETGLSGAPSISKDGRWVAYQSDRAQPGNLDIWIQPTAGGQARRLTTDPAIDDDPTLSPDGRLVAFRSERKGGGIYIVPADGSGERLLVAGGRSPAFSPDGRWIAYWKGTRDDAAPSGELYKISPHGGPPIRLAGDFADARYPTWNSNGQSLLFEGCRSNTSALSTCTEWWIMRAEGGPAVDSGALKLLRSLQILVVTPPVKSWLGDEVLFSAAHGPVTALWALPLPPALSHPTGAPRQITSGDVNERDPSVASTGTIAFGQITGALHIWRVPLQAGGPAHDTRLTNEKGKDGGPSVSHDGRWLYFIRGSGGVTQLIVMDLTTGQESPLQFSDDAKFSLVASPTGDRVAVETRHLTDSAIWVVGREGRARKLCSGCSHPTSWFAGGDAILCVTSKGEIAKLNAVTGRSTVVLSPQPDSSLSGGDWSAAHEYLLFLAARHGESRRAFAVRLPQVAETPQGGWIPVSADDAEMELPHWSNDGRTIFFLSKRDGNNCLWGLKFDPAGRRAIGKPFPLMHYHDPRVTPDRASPVARGLAVSQDSVFLNVGEVTDTVWVGRLTAPPWLGWWDKFSFFR